MNIFAISFISLIITLIVGIILVIILYIGAELESDKVFLYSAFSLFVVFIGVILIGIGFTTNNEKVYVEKYVVQKQTIETSLTNEQLTGLERVQLVSKATELNGEFAERKATFNLWYFVVFDNTIYDNIEFIKLG